MRGDLFPSRRLFNMGNIKKAHVWNKRFKWCFSPAATEELLVKFLCGSTILSAPLPVEERRELAVDVGGLEQLGRGVCPHLLRFTIAGDIFFTIMGQFFFITGGVFGEKNIDYIFFFHDQQQILSKKCWDWFFHFYRWNSEQKMLELNFLNWIFAYTKFSIRKIIHNEEPFFTIADVSCGGVRRSLFQQEPYVKIRVIPAPPIGEKPLQDESSDRVSGRCSSLLAKRR